MASFFGLDKVAKLRTIIKVCESLPITRNNLLLFQLCPTFTVFRPHFKKDNKKENFQDHGGVKAALYHLYWTDDLKVGKMDHNYDLTMTRHKSLFTAPQTGTHVGTDEYGNKYYHNPAYFRGRDR